MTQHRVVFILGGPGAGKGTQSNLLVQHYPCVHFSVGELLRNEQSKGVGAHAAIIHDCLTNGRIVPVEISLQLLQTSMQQTQNKSTIFLVDGFPRNFDNLLGWTKYGMTTTCSVWGVLVYTCPLQELQRRIVSRGETSNRTDDNLQSLSKRFTTFEQDTLPVVETLKRVSNLSYLKLWNIRGDQSLEKVWQDTQCVMNQFLLHDVLTANSQLLNAIETNNVELYNELCVYNGEKNNNDKLEAYEENSGDSIEISNPVVEFISGTKVVVSYDRTISTTRDGGVSSSSSMRESRVWSHEGGKGWVNIHFSRVFK